MGDENKALLKRMLMTSGLEHNYRTMSAFDSDEEKVGVEPVDRIKNAKNLAARQTSPKSRPNNVLSGTISCVAGQQ